MTFSLSWFGNRLTFVFNRGLISNSTSDEIGSNRILHSYLILSMSLGLDFIHFGLERCDLTEWRD